MEDKFPGAFQDSEEPVREFEDDEFESTYDPKSEFKKPLLAMEAVRDCREKRGKEMTKGFWNNKVDRHGNAIKVWVSDERKVYINAVIALEKLLSAECERDKKYQSVKKNVHEKINNLFTKYAYEVYEFDMKSGGWKKTGIKFMPQLDEELLVPSPQNPRVLINIKGGWDFKINAYYDELVPLYDELFEEINKVIFRLNDFGEKYSD